MLDSEDRQEAWPADLHSTQPKNHSVVLPSYKLDLQTQLLYQVLIISTIS